MTVLKDLLPAAKFVTIGGTPVEVRGLSLPDMGYLLEKHEEPLKVLLSDVGVGKSNTLDFSLMAKTWPSLVLDVIACGLNAKGQEDDVERIPLSVKLEVLKGVWELTVDDPKKVTAILSEFADAASHLRKTLKA